MRKMSQQQADLLEVSRELRVWLGRLEQHLIDQNMEQVKTQLYLDQDTMPPELGSFFEAIVKLGDSLEDEPAEVVNVCEHGDHPAPENERFCSEECQRCEAQSTNEETGCDNICGLGENEPSAKPPNCT